MEEMVSAALAAEDADGIGSVAGVATSGGAAAVAGRFGRFLQHGAFAGGEEEIGLNGVLLGVEVVVAAAEGVEGFVCAALDDAARFDDEDLVGAANGGETVGNDKRSAAAHQVLQALLD